MVVGQGEKVAATPAAGLRASLRKLQEDTQDFWAPLSAVARVDAATLSPLRFHREFVSRNVPVVLTNAMTSPQWEHALSAWQDDAYLEAKAGDTRVTVDVTPFGLGDAVLELPGHHRELFVMPEEREMPLAEFLRVFRDREGFDGVPYLSHQVREEKNLARGAKQFPALFEDVPSCVELAKEAFGNEPDAVNIWIGDERAVSTMHKDHYEQEFASARYRHAASPVHHGDEHNVIDRVATTRFHERYPEHAAWSILSSPDKGDTPWIPVDPLHIDVERFPLASALKPIEVVVNAGEMLYLPAMWYHRATQLCPTISVNYWHDMDFDCRYVYFNFVHDVAAAITVQEEDEEGEDHNR
ncbi:hypothetical protein BBJ28_00004814 [Nothophytophthora sp. Chile5]|nr:hypothetical protein BBJ28_00004814 [Nothophytophthora sp. Chile5]